MSYSSLILFGSKRKQGWLETIRNPMEAPQVICAIWMFLESILLWALVEYCPLFLEPRLCINRFFLQPETGTDVVIQMPSHGSFTKEAKMLFFWWLAFWPQKYEKHWMDADKQIVEAGSGPHSTKEPFTYGGCPKTQRIPDKVACAVCAWRVSLKDSVWGMHTLSHCTKSWMTSTTITLWQRCRRQGTALNFQSNQEREHREDNKTRRQKDPVNMSSTFHAILCVYEKKYIYIYL